jgi:tRNA threonylcarbamoyladenosine biosynthesis protein TsaE
VCLVEWPERAHGLLPVPDIAIALSEETGARRARIGTETERGRHCLEQLQE